MDILEAWLSNSVPSCRLKVKKEFVIVIYPANTTLPTPRANTIQILNTARELAAQGTDVHLVARKAHANPEEILAYYGIAPHENLHFHLVPAPLIKLAKAHESMVLKKTWQLLRKHTGEKILFTRDHLFASLLLKMRKLMKFKLVYEAHTLFSVTAKETYMPIAWNEQKEKRIQKREKYIFENADGIVYISSSLKKFVAQYFDVKLPSEVIHDGTHVAQTLRPRPSNLICYSGQFYLWKGVATLMESLRWIDHAKLQMFGGGYSTVHDDMREMQKIIDQYQLASKLEFRGFLPPSEIARAISDCSIGVLPLPNNVIGNHCNSPLKLFDYMANGLTVVASDLLTVRELIEHGKNGHLVEPGNARSLAEGINAVLNNQTYRQSLAQSAFETVKSYSWQKRGERLNTFLASLR